MGDDDRRGHHERMLAGDLYIADDPHIARDVRRAALLQERYNATSVEEPVARRRILEELLRGVGEDVEIRPPFHCDLGYRTTIGDRVFANYGLVILDVAEVEIGDDVQIATYVQLLTATHPLQAGSRRDKWEGSEPIAIGDNVWLGGGAIVCPGVTIGDDTVVGAGSVVVRDLPAGVLAVGNPARIVREL